MSFIIEMALTFMAACATVVLVAAIFRETPISATAGKEFHFRLGNQNKCPERVSDNFHK